MSYSDLEKEVKTLTIEFKSMPDILGKNKAKAEELRKKIFMKNQLLKDFDQGMGIHKRNIGNYSEKFKSL